MAQKYELDGESTDRHELLEQLKVLNEQQGATEDANGRLVTEFDALPVTPPPAAANAKAPTPPIYLMLAGLIGVFAIGTVILLMMLSSRNSKAGVAVPAVSNTPLIIAQRAIVQAGFRPRIVYQVSTVAPGVVISCDPQAGTRLKAGSDVVLHVSRPAQESTAPTGAAAAPPTTPVTPTAPTPPVESTTPPIPTVAPSAPASPIEPAVAPTSATPPPPTVPSESAAPVDPATAPTTP